jgi:beta-lactamase regulating signal transducer with metallopeptidase domain
LYEATLIAILFFFISYIIDFSFVKNNNCDLFIIYNKNNNNSNISKISENKKHFSCNKTPAAFTVADRSSSTTATAVHFIFFYFLCCFIFLYFRYSFFWNLVEILRKTIFVDMNLRTCFFE